MKVVLQRCLSARVEVEGQIRAQIGAGLTVFAGIFIEDDQANAQKMAHKIVNARIFEDENGRFNHSLLERAGEILLIPNFTLCGDSRKGNRPNFQAAARGETAIELFECLATLLREAGASVQTGVFGADMRVFVENDGPVTLILEF